jgi:CubicO group peptidase (beta-lactamase class C family)
LVFVTDLYELASELQTLLEEKCREGRIPGASVAICVGDEVIELATGVLNVDTGVEVTSDSLFQIGSISKVFTATLVMQLVDEGLVELDVPVRTYVPEFSLADQAAAEAVTVRQLLSHTGGFDGDVFDDFGRGDDAVTRYVEAMKDKQQFFPPGKLFSYCNSGFTVLGRLVECVRGLSSWDAALRKYLIGPLGLAYTVSLPEEAIKFRAAVGHLSDDGDEQRVAPTWALPRALAPAGASICASARDLISFTQMHMRGGIANSGTRVLSGESAAAMREPQVTVPATDGLPPDAWGLGWVRLGLPGGKAVYGHHGETIGQQALLRFLPEHGIAFAVLANGGAPMHVFQAIRSRIYALAGIEAPPLPSPPETPIEIDADRFIGRYENSVTRFDITRSADSGLAYTESYIGAVAESANENLEPTALVGLTPTVLITAKPNGGDHRTFGFPAPHFSGRANYLYSGERVAVRVDVD